MGIIEYIRGRFRRVYVPDEEETLDEISRREARARKVIRDLYRDKLLYFAYDGKSSKHKFKEIYIPYQIETESGMAAKICEVFRDKMIYTETGESNLDAILNKVVEHDFDTYAIRVSAWIGRAL